MDEQDYIVREIFAYYGRAMYQAQTIEKGILSIILMLQHKNGITQSRFDELLYEKSQLTFGQLKRELSELNCFSPNELAKINEFQEKRDFLTHNYWWDRAVEFNVPNLQPTLLVELNSYTNFFNELHELINNLSNSFLEKHKINFIEIQNELIAEGKTPIIESFRKLKKNEVLIDLFGYRNHPNSFIPIFQLEDKTYWTLCEEGLTQYKNKIIEISKVPLEKIANIFPINQFNPRPKVNVPWNYEIDLKKKGLKVMVSRDESTGQMKWRIK